MQVSVSTSLQIMSFILQFLVTVSYHLMLIHVASHINSVFLKVITNCCLRLRVIVPIFKYP